MNPTDGDARPSRFWEHGQTIGCREAFLVTSLVGMVISFLFLGAPDSERELPSPGIVRDVILDRAAVDAALGQDPLPATHARTPGGLIVLMPLRLLPIDDLTMYMNIVSALSLGLIVAAGIALMRIGWFPSVVLALALAASAAFVQSLYHGSTFLPIGAALLWGWVWLERDRQMLAGTLIAIAGVGRLWPFLLLVPMWRRGKREAVAAALAVTTLVTLTGMSLSGLTIAESVNTIVDGGATWITAAHNGSAASWFEHLGTLGIVLATLLVLALWVFGLSRSPDLKVDILWTIPIAVFASPLAWLPYLLVLAPVAMLSLGRPFSNLALFAVASIQLVGYRGMSDHWVTTLTITLTLFAVWHTHLSPSRAVGFRSPSKFVVETTRQP